MAGVVGAMAGEVGAAVLQALVQNLIDLTKNLISPMYDLDGEAQNLIKNLLTIQQFLNDAETRTIPSGDVKIWLKTLENWAFEADNVLDELHYHALSSKLNTDITKKKVLTTIFSPLTDMGRKRKMGDSIKVINTKLKSINASATQLGLHKKLADAPTVPYAGMETDSFSADPIFIGRDEVVFEIVDTLISSVATHDDERVFSILPIVGMGGLGKTTLTRNVFKHQNMKTQFGSRIWVHVSHVFDPITLFNKIFKELNKIFKELTPSQSYQGEISRQEIMTKLEEALKDKTYLLILDDVWNQDVSKWEDFLNSLSGVTTTKGNGIIVTTRKMDVASFVGTLPIHHLKVLSEEDCWKIIRAKTFGNEDVPLGFESIGREIAKRCGGLPLAASVVGGVLRCDKSIDKWVSIRDDWLPEGEEEGENNITKILRLSFNNLSSPSLKKCFAYCSIFPKGEYMIKQELIEMWMAEGFLQADGGDDMESVGDKFYNVLLHSSLLQVGEISNIFQNDDWCVMHDLVHDLASSLLGNADGVSRVRYLNHKEGKSSPITKEVAQHLRTLIFEADQPFDDNIFSDFKSLHVLILKCGESFTELPRSMRKLIHLRNLNISNTLIRHLPDWIGELHHLQTLREPFLIHYFISSRHLHVHRSSELPAEIGRLTSLQTLPGDVFSVRDKNGYKIEELGSLNNLKGSLTIECLEKVHDKEEAEKANLSKKSKLSELRLEWSYNREEIERINDENVLEGLQPHSNMQKLEIRGFNGKSFPEWTLKMAVRNEPQGSWVGLNQLVEIEFSLCTKCEEIPMLGHLPKLKSLCLGDLSNVMSINSSFYGIGNETGVVFPVLETLKLCDMDSLKEWAEVESGSTSEVKVFPNLQSLKISNCNQLMKVPFNQFSWALKQVALEGLSSLSNLPRLIECLAKSDAGLTELTIVGVPKFLATSVDQVWHFPQLQRLNIDVSMEGSTLDCILQGCSCDSLRKLYLTGMDSWECLPESIQHLTSLEELELNNFGMEELPEWFDQYISRTGSRFQLNLTKCERLKRLPSSEAMQRKSVLITLCPKLQ